MRSSSARLLTLPAPPSPPMALFTLTMLLVTTGLIMVYSASASMHFLVRQSVFAAAGLTGMLVFSRINYHHLRKVSTLLMILSLVALVGVLVFGVKINGSRRWVGIGSLRFQPSEPAKLALVIYMAKMLSDRRQYIKSFFSGVLPACIVTGIFAIVIVVEPDFGAALVLGTTIFGMWIAAEMRWFHLLGLVAAAMPAAIFAFLQQSFRMKRLLAFLSMDSETIKSTGLQLYQSLVAVGSGGMWGRGLGQSIQKYLFLPERHTDFIFAIMGEELGFVRVSLVILLFALLTLIGWRVAMRTTDLFGSLLAAGITLMIFINTAINMGVVLGILPTTGMVLPFISYGGTGLVIYMCAMGILMNIAGSDQERSAPGRKRA